RDLGRRSRAVRDLAGEVAPSPLGGATLDGALAELAERFSTGRVTVEVALEGSPPPGEVEDAVFLISAEAVSNAVRHAEATRVRVHVAEGDGGIVMRISDDGRGMPGAIRPGVGLTSIRERARMLGGRMRIADAGRGTEIVVELPAMVPRGANDTRASQGAVGVARMPGADGTARISPMMERMGHAMRLQGAERTPHTDQHTGRGR
ncbi:MAG: ATP-binding protein, partial [Microbacterium sp.]